MFQDWHFGLNGKLVTHPLVRTHPDKGTKAMKGITGYAMKFSEYMDDVTESELKSYIRLLSKMEMFVDDVDQEYRS